MSFFSFTIQGEETLTEDFKQQTQKISSSVPLALQNVGSEMIVSLKKHITNDFYSAYSPKVYPRRSENPKFGVPLDSEQNMSVNVSGNTLQFGYYPTGYHSGRMSDALNWASWSANMSEEEKEKEANRPIKPDPVHGDELIYRLQYATYDWKTDAPPRPFWNLFVSEQLSGGIMNAFIAGFKPLGYTVTAEGQDLTAAADERFE